MLNSLYIGATGMHAHQMQVDTISNNLTNMNTDAYKKSQIAFNALMGKTTLPAYQPTEKTFATTTGLGVLGKNVGKVFTTGTPKKTEQWQDVAILNEGLVEIDLPDGQKAFTRSITLSTNADGFLSMPNGLAYSEMIRVPTDAAELAVLGDGTVYAIIPDEKNPVEIGRLKLVTFSNPGQLSPIGENLYQETQESGPPRLGTYDNAEGGLFAQGYVESSNVVLVDEMMNLMLAQRAYEMSAKVVQTTDEMLSIINGLRR